MLSFLALSFFLFFKASYLSAMAGYSEKEWLKWKMRRGKWPDLGLNPFPFHFIFINNPPTTQSILSHILSTSPPPLLLPHPPSLIPTFPYVQNTVPGPCWREKRLREFFKCGPLQLWKQSGRMLEKEMGGW